MSITPRIGSIARLGPRGKPSTPRIAAAVPTSVVTTVARRPRRAPSQPQAAFPKAPPIKISDKANPTVVSDAPLVLRRMFHTG